MAVLVIKKNIFGKKLMLIHVRMCSKDVFKFMCLTKLYIIMEKKQFSTSQWLTEKLFTSHVLPLMNYISAWTIETPNLQYKGKNSELNMQKVFFFFLTDFTQITLAKFYVLMKTYDRIRGKKLGRYFITWSNIIYYFL